MQQVHRIEVVNTKAKATKKDEFKQDELVQAEAIPKKRGKKPKKF